MTEQPMPVRKCDSAHRWRGRCWHWGGRAGGGRLRLRLPWKRRGRCAANRNAGDGPEKAGAGLLAPGSKVVGLPIIVAKVCTLAEAVAALGRCAQWLQQGGSQHVGTQCPGAVWVCTPVRSTARACTQQTCDSAPGLLSRCRPAAGPGGKQSSPAIHPGPQNPKHIPAPRLAVLLPLWLSVLLFFATLPLLCGTAGSC